MRLASTTTSPIRGEDAPIFLSFARSETCKVFKAPILLSFARSETCKVLKPRSCSRPSPNLFIFLVSFLVFFQCCNYVDKSESIIHLLHFFWVFVPIFLLLQLCC